MQESRLPALSWLRTELRQKGWRYLSGTVGADGLDLVAIIIKSGAVSEQPALRSERTCAALWFPGGSTCIRLYCIYGGADGTQATHDLTSRWVREALLDAVTSRMTPAHSG